MNDSEYDPASWTRQNDMKRPSAWTTYIAHPFQRRLPWLATSNSGVLTCILTALLWAFLTAFCCFPGLAADYPAVYWVSTWATAVHPIDMRMTRQTIRMTVRTTLGGDLVSIRLSNRFGAETLNIGEAHVALSEGGAAITAGTDRALSFSGSPSIAIPPGAYVISDPVRLQVPPLGHLAISIYLPQTSGMATGQGQGLRTSYISPTGNFANATVMPVASIAPAYYWLSEVYVASSSPATLLVAFGDSITTGYRSTIDADESWPGALATLLIHRRPSGADISVINEGFGGNRILLPVHDPFHTNALARFDRDALDHPGVTAVIFIEGINDIGSDPGPDGKYVTANDLEAAVQQIITRCHLRRIKIIGGTLPPYGGAPYFTIHGDETRTLLNQWIRKSAPFDAVIDFEHTLEDPQRPEHLLPIYDSGDHLHPSDAGYAAMAQAAEEVLSKNPEIVSSR